MINVEVKSYIDLQQYCPDLKIGKPLVKVLTHKTKLGDLLVELKLPEEEKTAFVNGMWKEENYVLKDGDKITIFPAIGGG